MISQTIVYIVNWLLDPNNKQTIINIIFIEITLIVIIVVGFILYHIYYYCINFINYFRSKAIVKKHNATQKRRYTNKEKR